MHLVNAYKAAVGTIPHTAKPDVDNLCKSTTDTLSGIAWLDDSQGGDCLMKIKAERYEAKTEVAGRDA